MAPQRLEKIESGPGNGMASEASNPQDVVRGRAADLARLRLTSRNNDKVAKLQKKAPKALKSLDAELKSAPAFRASASGLRMLSFVGGPTRMGGFAPSRSEFAIGAEAFLAAGIRAMVPGLRAPFSVWPCGSRTDDLAPLLEAVSVKGTRQCRKLSFTRSRAGRPSRRNR